LLVTYTYDALHEALVHWRRASELADRHLRKIAARDPIDIKRCLGTSHVRLVLR